MSYWDLVEAERTMYRNVEDRLDEARGGAHARDRSVARRALWSRPARRLAAELAGRGWRWGDAWDRLIARYRRPIRRDPQRCRLPTPCP
jgi:hypothetical protein